MLLTTPPHPHTHTGDLANPPPALASLCLMNHWVSWKWQYNGKGWTKPPFRSADPSRLAANNDPSSWSTRAAAVSAVLASKADGVGFVLTNTEFGAVDLDKCRDSETGEIDPWAQTILDAVPSAYREITVSGTGLRVLGIAAGPETHRRFTVPGRKGAGIEVYRRATRFITVSGRELGHCVELPNIDKLIDDIVGQYDVTDQKKRGEQKPTNGGGNGIDDIDHLIQYGAPEGYRSEAFARVVWSLAGQGLSQDEIEKDLSRYPDGIGAKYGSRLKREIERCFRKRQDNKSGASNTSSHSWADPDWSIIDDRRGELPGFPVEVFTPDWQEWLLRAAHGAGVRPEHVAIPLLGVASSLIGMARRVRASRSWSEPMTLWTCIVADSGDRKTPGLLVTTRALDLIEQNNSSVNSAKRLAHETKVQRAKEIQKKWKEERQAALDANPPKEPPRMPIDAIDPGNFIEARLYATDPTIERLAALLQARPRGMMLIRDELSGLFANMSRYSGGSDRPFWLEAFNGGRHVVERVKGSIVVDRLLVGVIGSFQPDKLSRAFAGDEDGMYGRFLYAWPLAPDYRPLTNEVSEVEPELVNALTALIRLPSEDEEGVFATQPIWLSPEAVVEFEEFRKWVDRIKRGLDGRERQWFGKGETMVLRLAGVLAYMAWAIALGTSANGLDGINGALEPKTVDEKFITDAIRLWRDFFWPHARAAMRQIGLSDRHKNARRVLKWLKANSEVREISVKDVRRDALAQSLDAEQTERLLGNLVAAGWLKPKATEQTGGRPLHRWSVNPILYGDAESAGNAESPLF